LTRSASKELATGLLIDFNYAQLIAALTSANFPSASPPTTGIFAAGKGAISASSPSASPPTTGTFAAGKGAISANSPSASPPTTSTFAAGNSHVSSTSSVIGISTTRGSHNITKDVCADSNVVPNTNMVSKNDSKGTKGVAENLCTVSLVSYLDMGSSG
jgi:hypothetical protein